MASDPHYIQGLLAEDYFKNIDKALTDAGIAQPTLVIDKARFDANLNAVKSITDKGFAFRIVAKSLPSVPMLEYIMRAANTNRLMSFHIPFLRHVNQHIPHADILMGKPMPVKAVESYYRFIAEQKDFAFKPERQLQWLVDSRARLEQYIEVAQKFNVTMLINLEIDVGLHRGGFKDHEEFKSTLKLLKESECVELAGMMGYEAHITKVPMLIGGPSRALNNARDAYQGFSDLIIQEFDEDFLAQLTLNTGGSSTYPMYETPGLVNEIATASALVKPIDFDVYTLDHHAPAAFIAAPVLKMVDRPELPVARRISKVMHAVKALPEKACFIYGGNWLAEPCFPIDSVRADIFGHSSNQEMYVLKKSDNIGVDDFMYFRPTQSEAVFLQFGEIALYEDGKIIDWWSVFESKHHELTKQ